MNRQIELVSISLAAAFIAGLGSSHALAQSPNQQYYSPNPTSRNINPNFQPVQNNQMYRPPSNQVVKNRKSALKSRHRYLVKKANHLVATGKTKQALPILIEARAIKPNSPNVHFLIGLAYDQLGKPKQALNSYAKSLNLAKARGMDSCQLRVNLGNTLIKLNHLKEAFYDYRRAIEIEPNNGIPHLYLGRAYIITEDYNMALDEFRKCEELGLHNSYLPIFKSLCLSGLKNFSDARLELRPLLTAYSKSKYPELYQMAKSLNLTLEQQINGKKTSPQE